MLTQRTRKLPKNLIGFKITYWSDIKENNEPAVSISYRDKSALPSMLQVSKNIPLRWKISVLARYGSEIDVIEYIIKEPTLLSDLTDIVNQGKNHLITQRDYFPDATGWTAIVLG